MRGPGALALLLTLATTVAFSGCEGKSSASASGRIDSTTFQDPDSLVQALYDGFLVSDGYGEKVGGDFIRFFSPELRPFLSETEKVNAFLCDCHAYEIRDLEIGKYAPHRWIRVRLTEGLENDRDTIQLQLVLSRSTQGWTVSDIHYRGGYTLREALLPDLAPPAPPGETPRAAYLRNRKRLSELPSGRVNGLSNKYPRSKQEKRYKEFDSLIAYLANRIEDAVPPISVPGYENTAQNNIDGCEYDYCTSVDGRILSAVDEKDPSLVLLDRELLTVYAKGERLPVDLEELSTHSTFLTWFIGGSAHFFPHFVIPVQSPSSVSFVKVLGGMFSQDGAGGWVEGATLFAVQGDRVFLAYFDLPKHEIAECSKLYGNGGGDEDITACYAEKIRGQPYVDSASAQAQKILDRIGEAR